MNWKRFQYFFVLDVAILTAAIALRAQPKASPALVATLFGIGAATACLALIAGSAQRVYYRATRDLKSRLEERLALGDLALRTTAGMGGSRRPPVKVADAQNGMMVLLLLVHAFGLVASVW